MIKKDYLIFIYILFSCLIANSQTIDSVFADNNILVKQSNKNYYTIKSDNKSENIFYAQYNDTIKIIYFDDDLNVIDSIIYKSSFKRDLFYKKDSLNYGIYFSTYNDFTEDLDTLKIYCENDNGELLFNTTLYIRSDDTIIYNPSYINVEHTCENKFVVMITEFNYCKLFIVDSIGNIESSQIYYMHGYPYFFERENHYCLISSAHSCLYESTDVYYINKDDLQISRIDDFDRCYEFDNIKPLNDSLLIIAGCDSIIFDTATNLHFEASSILNINSLTQHSLYLYYTDTIIGHGSINPYLLPTLGANRNSLDFYNPSSIYKYYRYREYDYNSLHMVALYNFDINGGINFFYIINFGYGSMKLLHGIKATQDGGLIVLVNNWIAKISDDGFVNLTNIETNEKERVKIYPNPAKDFINVDIEATNFKQSEIELFDMQGKLVKKANLNSKQGNRIDVSNLNSGAYTYNVMLNGKTISGKVIIGK